jgi:TPR repeat protein
LHNRLESLAQQGNAEATYHLGMIYHLGLEGVTRDYRRAFEHFRRAADGGDPLGAYKVGCYYAGQGEGTVPPDAERALRYKLIAAEAGYDLAQVDVARIYYDRGEHDRALHWLEIAARQGNSQGIGGALVYRARGGPNPDGPRAWLYFELLRRDMARVLERIDDPNGRISRAEVAAALEQSTSQLRQTLLPMDTEADRVQAQPLVAAWREERSPLSQRADQGLDAARRLVGLAPAT